MFKTRRRRLTWLTVLGGIAIALAAVGGSAAIPSAGAKPLGEATHGAPRITIEMPFFGTTNQFFNVIRKGANEAARQIGSEVRVIWTVQKDFSLTDAVNSMNTSLARHPTAWAVADADPRAMEPVMKKAISRGITVIAINSRGDLKNAPYLFFIGADPIKEGQMAANTVLAATKGKLRRAMCANQVLGHAILSARCKGFRGVLQARGVKVDEVDVAGGPTQAQEKTTAYLRANSDAGAIYTLTAGPEAFDPALQAVKRLKRLGKVKLVVNDLSTSALQAVRRGEVLGLIDQQQYLQGYLAVKWLWLYEKYGMLPGDREILTGPALVSKKEVNKVIDLVAKGYR